MQMDIRKITFPKKIFNEIPENERLLFILLGHFNNELAILHKLLVYSMAKPRDDSEHELKAHNAQMLFLARLYAGKLFEGWEVVRKKILSTKEFSMEYEAMSSVEGKAAFDELKKYFGGTNRIANVRNKYAFHYSSDDDIREQYGKFDNKNEFIIYTANFANSLYYMSDEIINRAIFEIFGAETVQKSLDLFFNELKKLGEWFFDFTGGYLVIILDKYFKERFAQLQWEIITINNPPKIDEISIPFFVTH